jgi:hypothetical protein
MAVAGSNVPVLTIYLGALALSCFFLQVLALAIYVKKPGARRWMEPIWCFLNPALYLLVIEPAMNPALPWFRASLWTVFAAYWTVRLFGELWPPPEWLQRSILVGVILGCAAALVRGCLAVTADADAVRYLVVIAFGGFSLYAIPMLMAVCQLKAGRLPFALADRPAQLLALTLAAGLGTNVLLAPGERGAARFQRQYASQIKAAAQEWGVSPEDLSSLARDGESGRTPLGKLVERVAMYEWLDDPKSHFILAPALADVPIGPLQLTPRETMRAIRQTGAPWTKEYRETRYDVPKTLPGNMPGLTKSEVVRLLLDEKESLPLGALVLAARGATQVDRHSR